MGIRGFRIGVFVCFIKYILVDYGNKDIKDIEILWYGVKLFYIELFEWLDNKVLKLDIFGYVIFYFVMLFYFIEDKEIDMFIFKDW